MIKETMQKVKSVLTNDAASRDSYHRLFAKVWQAEYNDISENGTAKEVFQLISDKKLSNPVSIDRCSRKLQQENPSLRGNTYKARHEKQAEVKLELGYSS